MSIIRGEHSFDDKFTQIPNDWLRDSRLNLASIGLLAQIMSHRPGWKITQENLAIANKMGRDAIRTALNQLIEYGYLRRSKERERNSRGQVAGYTYTTSDPIPNPDKPMLENPTQDNPLHKNTIDLEQQVKNTKRATQISETFEVTPELRKWALENLITIDIVNETKKFIAYYQANEKPMKNWTAAWRNWILKAQDFQKPVWEKMKDKKEFDSRSATRSAKEATKQIIAESEQAKAKAAPPPKCEHGKSLVSCLQCLRKNR
jgi:hypothetical protein